ncbi:hypothetical protein QB910_000010 [Dabrowskivirus KKP3916]|uniref:DUF4373 domain-containing protein n=1 Tax=Alicyclobacillus phage KKP_3916 TaxID=3040651 RepID=A0AAT9V7F9_9CAUD|nr:hypothetical protein QB910_000010 [Alicyclobacillus phage KKP 3916]
MYIFSPKSRKRIFLDNSISDYNERLEKVAELAFTREILNYCYQNRFIWSKRQEQAYLNAEHILENIATYLLMGMFKGANIMTLYKIRQKNQREIPESNAESNAVDLIYGADYGGDIGQENARVNATSELSKGTEVKKDQLDMSVAELNRRDRLAKKQSLRYRDSKTFRMENLFSTRPVETYRLEVVKERDENGKEKIVKNVFGQPIFIDKRVTIGGRKGLIDRDKDKGSWCTVDTDNHFTFMGREFVIDSSVEAYRVDDDNQCLMDKILAYYLTDTGEYVFFDENICRVDAIKEVAQAQCA